MRSNLLARRIAAPALGLALAATMAACSSSGSSTTASPSSAPPSSAAVSSPAVSGSTPSVGSTEGAAAGDAKAQITTNWEAFFSGKTSAATKISLLENGQKFASVINAQAGSGLAASAGAKVKAVVVNSPAQATVNYDITLNGTPALQNQTGTAVYQDGMWKVGDVSFCQLLKIENAGTAPSVCS
jgi:hypothetical protein